MGATAAAAAATARQRLQPPGGGSFQRRARQAATRCVLSPCLLSPTLALITPLLLPLHLGLTWLVPCASRTAAPAPQAAPPAAAAREAAALGVPAQLAPGTRRATRCRRHLRARAGRPGAPWAGRRRAGTPSSSGKRVAASSFPSPHAQWVHEIFPFPPTWCTPPRRSTRSTKAEPAVPRRTWGEVPQQHRVCNLLCRLAGQPSRDAAQALGSRPAHYRVSVTQPSQQAVHHACDARVQAGAWGRDSRAAACALPPPARCRRLCRQTPKTASPRAGRWPRPSTLLALHISAAGALRPAPRGSLRPAPRGALRPAPRGSLRPAPRGPLTLDLLPVCVQVLSSIVQLAGICRALHHVLPAGAPGA